MTMRVFTETKIRVFSSIAFLAMFSLISPGQAIAEDDVTAVKRPVSQPHLSELRNEIKGLQGTISVNRGKQATLKNEISIYDAQIRSNELEIQAKETQIEDTDLQIEELEAQIERRVAEIEENKKILASLILQLYQQDSNSVLQLGLGSGNFS